MQNNSTGGGDRQGREWGGKGANMAKVGKEREGCSEWHHLKEELGKVEGEGGQDALDQYWSVATQSDKSDRQLDK